MRNACDSDSRCGLDCDASARDAKSLAMWVERCEPLRYISIFKKINSCNGCMSVTLHLSRQLAPTESIAVQWVLMAPHPMGPPFTMGVRAHCSPICPPEECVCPMGHDGWPHPFVGGAAHQLNPLKPHSQRISKIIVCSRKPATQHYLSCFFIQKCPQYCWEFHDRL